MLRVKTTMKEGKDMIGFAHLGLAIAAAAPRAPESKRTLRLGAARRWQRSERTHARARAELPLWRATSGEGLVKWRAPRAAALDRRVRRSARALGCLSTAFAEDTAAVQRTSCWRHEYEASTWTRAAKRRGAAHSLLVRRKYQV
eukprot:4130254-Pleurochrysis_carterae.AAC.1